MSARIGWRACPRSQRERERESWALYAASLILLVFYKVSDQKLRGRAYTCTLGGKREWQHLFSRKPKRPRKQHRGRLHSITRSLLFSSLLSLFKRRCQLLLSCHFSHLVVSEKIWWREKKFYFIFLEGSVLPASTHRWAIYFVSA